MLVNPLDFLTSFLLFFVEHHHIKSLRAVNTQLVAFAVTTSEPQNESHIWFMILRLLGQQLMCKSQLLIHVYKFVLSWVVRVGAFGDEEDDNGDIEPEMEFAFRFAELGLKDCLDLLRAITPQQTKNLSWRNQSQGKWCLPLQWHKSFYVNIAH